MEAVCAGHRSTALVPGHHHQLLIKWQGSNQSERLEAETRNQKTEEHAALFLSAVSKGS